MRYRIRLYGFSEAECRAMQFSLEHPSAGEAGFEVVDGLSGADFAIVDAESPDAVTSVASEGLIGRALFVGAADAPADAPNVLPRPIDPTQVRRSLVRLMAKHGAESSGQPFSNTISSGAQSSGTPFTDTHFSETHSSDTFDDPDEIVVFEPQMVARMVKLPTRPEELPPMPETPETPKTPKTRAATPAASRPAPDQSGRPEVIGLSEFPVIGLAPRAAETQPAEEPGPTPQDKKAAARTAARRARLSYVHTGPGALDNLRDVLLLDPDLRAAEHLRELLDLFGFRVHVTHHIAHAADVLSRQPLVAAFVDVPLNGADQGDGVTLLQTIQGLPTLVGYPTPAVLLVSGALRPSDQVRARLAGVDVHLQKPVSRGDVARALEGCDVLLPADARRSV